MTGNDDVAARTATDQTAAHEAAEVADEQGLLFDDDVSTLPSDTGYRGPTACNAAGITYRQLDYWARTGLVEPTVRGATGSGTQRLYSFRDILLLKVIKRLLDAGISLQQIRTAVQHLRKRGTDDLTRVTLMSDGASVYECTSNDEVIDLLQGGQGVFGIAIGGVWREIEGSLAELPSERARRLRFHSGDELSVRAAAPGDDFRPSCRRPAPDRASTPGHGGADRRVWRRECGHGVSLLPTTARESLRHWPAASEPERRSAEGANPPRNLSGARTGRARQVWSRRAGPSSPSDRRGVFPTSAGPADGLRSPRVERRTRPDRDRASTDPQPRRPRAAFVDRHIGPGPRSGPPCSPRSASTPSTP